MKWYFWVIIGIVVATLVTLAVSYKNKKWIFKSKEEVLGNGVTKRDGKYYITMKAGRMLTDTEFECLADGTLTDESANRIKAM